MGAWFPHMIALFALTSVFVLGILGTGGKVLFDDWRVRQASRRRSIATEPDPL